MLKLTEPENLMDSFLDIIARKKAEETLKKSVSQYRDLLAGASPVLLMEKETLLEEIYLQLKHNLQIISNQLKTQLTSRTDTPGKPGTIDFAHYIKQLTYQLLHSYNIAPNAVQFKIDIENEEFFPDIDNALSCGLIVNQLASNFLKHILSPAPDNPDSIQSCDQKKMTEIFISLHKQAKDDGNGTNLSLIISHNGNYLSRDIDFPDWNSLGMKLIGIIIQKIEGTILCNKTQTGGISFKVTFKMNRSAAPIKKLPRPEAAFASGPVPL